MFHLTVGSTRPWSGWLLSDTFSRESLSIRPWTRLECARLLSEARNTSRTPRPPAKSSSSMPRSRRNSDTNPNLMNGERNLNAQFESVYSRFPRNFRHALTDNYHFGQTLLNDYGRPYEEGFNAVDGASG